MRHWIPTYCDYIDTFVDKSWDYYPGEHHFVALYLLPRLMTFDWLGVPYWVNPDGMKKQWADVIYYEVTAKSRTCSLAIEVKQLPKRRNSFSVTKAQYGLWSGGFQPHLFVFLGKHGLALLPWPEFRKIYLSSPQTVKGRNAKPISATRIPWGFPSYEDKKFWEGAEKKFMSELRTWVEQLAPPPRGK